MHIETEDICFGRLSNDVVLGCGWKPAFDIKALKWWDQHAKQWLVSKRKQWVPDLMLRPHLYAVATYNPCATTATSHIKCWFLRLMCKCWLLRLIWIVGREYEPSQKTSLCVPGHYFWYGICFQHGVYDTLIEQKPSLLCWTSWTSCVYHREMARNAVCVFNHKRCPVAVQFTCGTLPINTVQQVNLYWNWESPPHNLWYVHFQQVNTSSWKDLQSCMLPNNMKCFAAVRARCGNLNVHSVQLEAKCRPATPSYTLLLHHLTPRSAEFEAYSHMIYEWARPGLMGCYNNTITHSENKSL